MQLLHDTHIDFMKYRRFWIIVSLILVVVGLYTIFGPHKLNLGIDFAGGTQITLAFRDRPDIDRIRAIVEQTGFREPVVQSYGKAEDREVIVKTAVVPGSEEGSRDRIVSALSRAFNQGKAGLDLNQASSDGLTQFLAQADPDRVRAQGPEAARAHYAAIAETIYKERQKNGIFTSLDRVSRLPGVSPAVAAALQQGAHLGTFVVVGTENVGPQVGRELRQQGFWAVILSMLAMLAYIGFRFELRFGIGAIMASLHDITVTLGLFALLGFEFNLTTIAAFLTLVGYSTNDTVVIFDRVRENMRKSRRKPLIELMNESINETLSRTIITGGLTFLTVLSLLILGGDVLRGFAFVMTVGIVVGTYSSIYVASPFALLWEHLFGVQGKWRKGKPGALSRGTAGRPEPRIEPRPGEAAPEPRRRSRQARRRA
ncbi:MAG TPA: protein translocase subunit SecF [Thermoanaerobaculia bacterium]|jgi:preprotein translocase subunit SecF|nr:protein translocase subunit SecF [Thermoanaerobaculia bacterium]